MICMYDKLQKLLEMEELVHSTPSSNEKCSNNSAHVQVKNLLTSWYCDKENLVLDGITFEVDQVQSILVHTKINFDCACSNIPSLLLLVKLVQGSPVCCSVS